MNLLRKLLPKNGENPSENDAESEFDRAAEDLTVISDATRIRAAKPSKSDKFLGELHDGKRQASGGD